MFQLIDRLAAINIIKLSTSIYLVRFMHHARQIYVFGIVFFFFLIMLNYWDSVNLLD